MRPAEKAEGTRCGRKFERGREKHAKGDYTLFVCIYSYDSGKYGCSVGVATS
jgi:hypothetical protein